MDPARPRNRFGPAGVIFLCVPALLFGIGLYLIRDHPRFDWLSSWTRFPWEFWTVAVCGSVATAAGILDWRYHRSGRTAIGHAEHRSEVLALVVGGVPLFVLMATASLASRPEMFLLPVLVVVLYTTVLICYDEFVFHRRRCGRYETTLHRLLVFGNGFAWLAWMHWCFVRELPHV
jgi:hypothetical protein